MTRDASAPIPADGTAHSAGEDTAGEDTAGEDTVPAALAHGPSAPCRVTVFHCNDLHHASGDAAHGPAAMAYRLSLARQAASQAANEPESVIMLTAGDDMTGGILDELLPNTHEAERPQGEHAGYAFLAALGVHVSAVGNHDLDRGLNVLDAAASAAPFPLLAANLHLPRAWAHAIHPAAILHTDTGARIGVIGVTTAGQLPPAVRHQIKISDPLAAVLEMAAFLLPLTDIRIILSHLGYRAGSARAVVEPYGDHELAATLGRHGRGTGAMAHLIVGGHTHDALNHAGLESANVVEGIPIVQAGAFGDWLGEVNLRLIPGTAGTQVNVEAARLWQTTMDSVAEPDRAACERAACERAAHFYHHVVSPRVAMAEARLAPRLGTVASATGGLCPDLQSLEFNRGESATANLLADCLTRALAAAGHQVDFALVDSSLAATPFRAGPFTRRDLFDMIPHADVIEIAQVPRAALVEFLQDNLRRIDAQAESGFVQSSRELRYVGHATEYKPGAWQLVQATLHGEPLVDIPGVVAPTSDSTAVYIALPSFTRVLARRWELAHPGPHFDLRAFPHINTGLLARTAIEHAIREVGYIDASNGFTCDGRVTLQRESRGRMLE